MFKIIFEKCIEIKLLKEAFYDFENSVNKNNVDEHKRKNIQKTKNKTSVTEFINKIDINQNIAACLITTITKKIVDNFKKTGKINYELIDLVKTIKDRNCPKDKQSLVFDLNSNLFDKNNSSSAVHRTFTGYVLKKPPENKIQTSSLINMEVNSVNMNVLLVRTLSGHFFTSQRARLNTLSAENIASYL